MWRDGDCEETKSELSQLIQKLNYRLTELMEKERAKAKLEQELRAWQLEQEHFERYCSVQDVEGEIRLPLVCRTPEKILDFLAETSAAEEFQLKKKLLYRIKILFKFGILNVKKLEQNDVSILLTLQSRFYQMQIQRLEQRIEQLMGRVGEGFI